MYTMSHEAEEERRESVDLYQFTASAGGVNNATTTWPLTPSRRPSVSNGLS
jgi:hypothetical protein